jgi:hypothetical protein
MAMWAAGPPNPIIPSFKTVWQFLLKSFCRSLILYLFWAKITKK